MRRMLTLAAIGLAMAALLAAMVPALSEGGLEIASISLDKTGTVRLNIGETLALTPQVYPAGSVAPVTWTSSKPSVAAVDNGVVVALSGGVTSITAKCGGRKARLKVKVVGPYLPKSVSPGAKKTIRLALGAQYTLTPTLKPVTASTPFTWKSSKRKVVSVTDGVVTAKKVGTARITVTTRNGKKASVRIKVYSFVRQHSRRGSVNLSRHL